jgi:hypothetical protein
MRSLLQRCALAFGAVVGLLGTRPATANAQKALVYCPVSIDATGCNAIVTALTGPAYPLGVDRGYDGTSGTVDLKAVDLFSYSVFVVPSLADDSTSQPYAKLRDPEVVEHLKAALIGRIAMWSGTPDQGATNRTIKDALIQNLAGWAGGAFATAKGPGLVALLDASADISSRYDWVRAITPVPVTSDATLAIYNSVRALNQRATTILTSGAGAIVYDNMATFGFALPNGAPGVNLDAVGQTGTSQGGQVVLVTMEAGNSGGALVKTDKADYAPGETVTITGSGWQANETVKLTLHMDPLRDADTELTATADGNGNFTNTDFAPGQYDVGVRFVLTAIGQASGRRAQTTFTDGNKVTFSTTAGGTDVSTFGSIPQSQCFNAFVQERQGSNLDVAPTGGRVVTLTSTAAGATFYAGAGCAGASVATVTIPAGQQAVAFSFVLTTVGAQTINGNAGFTGSSNASATATVTAPANVATTLTLSVPSPTSVTYGSTGPVTLTSTLTRTTGGAAVAGATVAFTVDAVSVGTGTTNASGVATVSYNPSSLSAGSHTIGSSFTAATISGTSYLASTSGTQSLTVNTRPVTVTADPKAKGYGDADPTLTYQITSGSLASGDAFSGALARVAGENVGSYAIQKGTLALSANYVLTYVGASLTITTRAVTVTADPKTKVYGDADPTLTYQITSGTLAFADAFSGALTRVAGNNVGTFAIQQGTLALNANYVLTYVGANLTITGRPITVTADAKSKVYGDVDPALTYQITNGSLATGDAFTGAISRVAGENVGTYAIQQGTLAAGANYTLVFVPANLTVTTRAIAVAADAQTKVYGEADPSLTYKVTSGSLVTGDSFSGSLTRATGETVGTYAIAQGTLSAGGNYALSFTGANLTITTRAVTVTADAKTKGYGDADPTLTYAITTGSLAFTDAFTGALARAAAENVGTHAITQGTLALNSNYALSFVGANLTITTRAIAVKADAKTKTYGDADPALTYQITSGSLAFSDAFSGALSRVAGEAVGTYAIGQGTLALSANYSLSFVGANLSITQRAITVTADAKTKVYGDNDPTLTYQLTAGTLVTGDALTGTPTRVAGEPVGTYAIQQGGVTAGPNYLITFVPANFTITQRPIAVTADAKSKIYGEADPVLTYQVTSGNLVFGDTFSGSLTRVAGETVATYAINKGTLSAGANYELTFVAANLTITTRPVTVTAAPKTKVYGEADPALTYQITTGSLAFSDAFSGNLTRATGEDVGIRAITQGTLALNSNYVLSFVGADLTITARAITVKADPKTKVYGDADPALTYQITSGSLVFEDHLTGNITRAAGENVGSYAITQGALTATTNYTLTFVPSTLEITKRQITVTAHSQTKVYGNADPAFTYQITSGNLVGSDQLTGALSRASGENVGTYAITQGALTAGGNYDLTFAGDLLTITKRAVTVTAAAKTKTYGDADVALTYAITTGSLAFSDAFSGSLVRDAGENAGTYAILQGTLTLGGNYDLSFVGANFTITKRAVAITADAKTKTYGDADPALTYHISSGSLAFSDAFTGSLTRAAGENVGSYAIQQNTVALNPTNYDLTYAGANLTIGPRAVTVTADAKTKVYGESDPALTYQITTGNLVGSDAFSGALTRAAGEDAATHAINQGTLALSTNYALTYVGANLTITPRPISVTADPKTKVYGNADPALTYQITSGSLVFSDAFAGALTRAPGENVGMYAIAQGTLALSTNYALSYAGANLTVTTRPVAITADAKSKTYGDADPTLTFHITSGTLAFSDAFSGALTRVAGENVGMYAINQGTVVLTANYALTYAGENLTIIKRLATWTTQPATKVFGAADPAPLTTGSGTNFLAADGVTATYGRAAGETVPGGPYAITATLSSGVAGALSNYTITNAGAPFTITKATPAISWTGMPSTMNQGAALTAGQLNAYAVPVSGPGQVAGSISYTLLPSTSVSVGSPVYGVGGYSVKATFVPTDLNYYGNDATNTLTLLNVAPVVTSIGLPAGAVPLGSATNLTARFTDAGLTDTHTFSIDWDWDPTTNAKTPGSYTSPWTAVPAGSEPSASTQGTVTGGYTYPAAGVYTVRVTVKDNSGDMGSKTSQTELFAYVVVYDASGGFVTGGGWINSPVGACQLTTACGGAVGKANFGFVAKYKKGQSAPDGNTEFQFQAGNINFSSTTYDWLVVAGSKAQYKGVGTINGSGTYGFMLTATDNESKGGPDTFRMKIWIKNANGTDGAVVYDNQMGAPDDGTPTTVLGGGSIQIHQ